MTTVDRSTPTTAARLLPPRPPDSHKGTFGTLVCVCGSLDYAGAALLCGPSAARGGAGLVALAVPHSLQPLFAGRVPELITLGLPEYGGGRRHRRGGGAAPRRSARLAAALVIGPGLRRERGLPCSSCSGCWRQTAAPRLVVDGGGLNLLARSARRGGRRARGAAC